MVEKGDVPVSAKKNLAAHTRVQGLGKQPAVKGRLYPLK
jgi:hypothetical protein